MRKRGMTMSQAEIRSSVEAATAQASTLEGSVSSLGDVSLQSISGVSTGIPGASLHDSAATALEAGLRTWTDLINSDASAIQTTGLAFDSTDHKLAHVLLDA